LKRFQQTLPVKYIEQLRASKTKAAKKPSTAKANTVPIQTENEKPNNEKESGGQKAQKEKSVETEFAPTINQKVSANEIQQSLF
jgi:hypothetical protein